MTQIHWLSNHDDIDAIGPWDTGLLRHLFEGRLGRTRVNYTSSWETARSIHVDQVDGAAVVVLPARHHYGDIGWLNSELDKLPGVVLILVGDEDAGFPWQKISHQNIRFWVQMPDPKHYADMARFAFFFGNGWRYEFPDWLESAGREREHAWMFAGQVTNNARKRAVNGLKKAHTRIPGQLLTTTGFAQGVEGEEYARLLANSWIAPAPGGPKSVDTFRLYEALEAGCVPFADHDDIHGMSSPYWRMMYGEGGIPTVRDWEGVGGLFESVLEHPHRTSARSSAWWQREKRRMIRRMESDLSAMSVHVERPQVTAVITTSPVPSNPSLDLIEETIDSIPDAFDVVVGCDGVRPEQEGLAAIYDEFLYRLCVACERDPHYARVTPHVGSSWLHQAGTTRAVLGDSVLVDTPAFLFLEHDTPVVTDEPIDWDLAVEVVAGGYLDVLRFHHESHVLPVHEHLMQDHQTTSILGLPVRRTRQWSQRPHLANTAYYRRVLDRHFPVGARTMIEDKMHSVVQVETGHRIALYHPEGNIKRSYHLDGRGEEPKFDMRFE